MTIGADAGLPFSGIVTVPEFSAHLNNMNFNASQARVAAALLLGTQRDLENRLNRPVGLSQVREYVKSSMDGFLYPSVTPVLKVISRVVVAPFMSYRPIDWSTPFVPDPVVRDPLIGDNGQVIDKAPMNMGAPYIVDNGIWVGNIYGTLYFVEYIGGMDGSQDQNLKQAIMRVAARSMVHNHDDTLSLRQGVAQAAEDPDPLPQGWTDAELKALERYRHRVMA